MIGVSIKEASERTGISVPALRQKVYRRSIRFRKAGRTVYLWPADVDALANAWQGRPVRGATDAERWTGTAAN